MSLAEIIAACYVLFGAFGLLVVSLPDNYRDMFHEHGRPLVGFARLAHAYIVLLLVVACGASVWLFPPYTPALAIVVLTFVIGGKIFRIATGSKVKCMICLVVGTVAASVVTWVLVAANIDKGTG